MKHIFYLLTIFPILWEALNLTDAKRVNDFIQNVKLKQKVKNHKYTVTEINFIRLMAIYFLWTLVGLFSFQWPAFLFLFLVGFISKKRIWYRRLDSFISFSILIFIILNAYYFNIDIWTWLKIALR
jgi:hypothetical protein